MSEDDDNENSKDEQPGHSAIRNIDDIFNGHTKHPNYKEDYVPHMDCTEA
jgi:hypothetical protein